jgi:hypothetical protein
MTLQEVKEQMILKIPRLTKGKRSQETKYDYFGNKIDIGDDVCRFYSSQPDVGVVISVSDKGIEMTCERAEKSSNYTKTGKSTWVTNSISFRDRDFSNALKQLATHNSTKRIWCYSSTSSYGTKNQNQIVNLTKLNLI